MHIVVAGYPRAGTTMFYNMLRTTVKHYKFYDKETKATVAHKQDPYTDKITKRPTDISDLPELIEQIPDFKYILCIRDPRSILVSEHASAPGRFKISWDSALKTNRKKGIVGIAPGFIERHQKLLEVIEKCNPVIVFYENLVKDPNIEQERLKEIFSFEYTGKFTDFYNYNTPYTLELQLNGLRPVSQDKIESWKQYPMRIKQQFNECPELFEILKYWDYEKDDEGFTNL